MSTHNMMFVENEKSHQIVFHNNSIDCVFSCKKSQKESSCKYCLVMTNEKSTKPRRTPAKNASYRLYAQFLFYFFFFRTAVTMIMHDYADFSYLSDSVYNL